MVKPGEYEMESGIALADYSGILQEVGEGPPERSLRVLTEYLERATDEDTTVLILREMAPWFVALGLADEAMERLDAAVQIAEEAWGRHDLRSLVVRNSQMYWAGQVGMSRRAQALAEDLVPDAREHLELGSKLRHAIRNNAARILELGPIPELADILYQELLDEIDDLGQEGQTMALTSRHNYGEYLRDVGEFERSTEVFQKLLLILTEYRGTSSFNTLAVRHELAVVTLLGGKRTQALDMWSVLLADVERFLEPGSQLELDILGTLISDALDMHDVPAAVRHLDRLLDIHRSEGELGMSQELAKMRNALLEANA